MTGDLVERLRAELDRLEGLATAAAEAAKPPWATESEAWERATRAYLRDANGNPQGESCGCCSTGTLAPAVAAHAAANDPAHVLRTIQAHRKIIDRHRAKDDEVAHRLGLNGLPPWCAGCGANAPCPDLLAVASIYFPEGTERADVDL